MTNCRTEELASYYSDVLPPDLHGALLSLRMLKGADLDDLMAGLVARGAREGSSHPGDTVGWARRVTAVSGDVARGQNTSAAPRNMRTRLGSCL